KDKVSIWPKEVSFAGGIKALLSTPLGDVRVSSPLLGQYNLQNIMAAVGLGLGWGLDSEAIQGGVVALKAVPGRLERIQSSVGFDVIVDYAHTGDALERVLTSLRGLARGRVITVFGCGGNRDRGKRPVMGEVATRLSDITFVTSDNPRWEDPLEITKGIEAGIKTGGKGQGARGRGIYTIIPDRHEAIRAAINMADMNDIILVAGKGHEDYQIIGDRKIPFDDVEEVRKAINERCKISS
ncbi:MAG: UDP-N-acetylmuramoyl-L-alanyl-D-glutamate--2,6-diaminopimelate ligase, partial [Deltaproteobacteria bacterium]|nr:UDP-N-acetylmuramoyl-L-alanyl-D-glutamate--2,6-diaminopimelate ligase [Deltaproteobacteria bacterium]